MSRLASAFCASLLAAGFVHPQVQPGTTNHCERMMSPAQVLMLVSKRARPAYPEEAIRAKTTGVVVAEICVPAGIPTAAVTISSTPSEGITRSVRQALSQWRFQTWFEKGSFHAYGGKVIFYFLERDGEWKVLDPADSFYVGPRFAVKQQRSVLRQRPSS